MSAGTECSSGIHATAVSASCSLKWRPVSAEQRPAATNPVSGRGLGISRKMNLAFLLRLSRSCANSGCPVCCNRWSFRLVAVWTKNAIRIFVTTCLLGGASAPAKAQSLEGTLKKMKETGIITIGYRDSSIPLSYLDDKLQPVGFSLDLCKHVVEAAKAKLRLARGHDADLVRFGDAQVQVYRQVVEELIDGRKQTHYLWFIFPQLCGLGHSAMAHDMPSGIWIRVGVIWLIQFSGTACAATCASCTPQVIQDLSPGKSNIVFDQVSSSLTTRSLATGAPVDLMIFSRLTTVNGSGGTITPVSPSRPSLAIDARTPTGPAARHTGAIAAAIRVGQVSEAAHQFFLLLITFDCSIAANPNRN
jgi:Protein of unknown function (DUF1810)